MIEVVFNESAEGCLKVAQSFGKGKYRGGPISVFIRKKDGSEPTQEEKEVALREAKEKERLAWQKAAGRECSLARDVKWDTCQYARRYI